MQYRNVEEEMTALSLERLGIPVSVGPVGLLNFSYRGHAFEAVSLCGVLHVTTVLRFDTDDYQKQVETCFRIRSLTSMMASPGTGGAALLSTAIPVDGKDESLDRIVEGLVTVEINGALDIYGEMYLDQARRRRLHDARLILKGFLRSRRHLDDRTVGRMLRNDSPNPFSDPAFAEALSGYMAREHGLRILPENICRPVLVKRLVKLISRFLP